MPPLRPSCAPHEHIWAQGVGRGGGGSDGVGDDHRTIAEGGGAVPDRPGGWGTHPPLCKKIRVAPRDQKWSINDRFIRVSAHEQLAIKNVSVFVGLYHAD